MEFIGKIKDKVKDNIIEELSQIIPENEEIEKVFIVIEDYVAFTSRRVVLIDKSLLSSKKTLSSIPYSKINFTSLKKGGFMKLSKELIIGAGGSILEVDAFSQELAFNLMKEVNSRIV